MIPHREEADEAGEDEADGCGEWNGKAEEQQEPVGTATEDAGKGIDFTAEDDGFVVEQYVADDSSGCSRDATHDDGYPDGLPALQAFLQSGYVEEGQAQGVEDKPGIVEPLHLTVEGDDEKEGGYSTDEVGRLGHPERGDGEQQVAQGSSANGHGYSADITAEPVELLGCCMTQAGDGKGKGAQYFYEADDEGGIHNENQLLPSSRSEEEWFQGYSFVAQR